VVGAAERVAVAVVVWAVVVWAVVVWAVRPSLVL
jgi:hypothetical protein